MPKVKGTPTPRFILLTQKEPKQPTYIHMYFHYKGKRLKYSTGEKCPPEAWAKGKAKTTGKYSKNTNVNLTLNKIQELTIEIYRDTKGELTPDQFKKELDLRMGYENTTPEPVFNFPNFIETFMNRKRTTIGGNENSWKIFRTTQKHLLDFTKEKGLTLEPSKIDKKFVEDFRDWMYNTDHNFKDSSVHKVLKTLNRFLNEAQKEFEQKGETIRNIFKVFPLRDFVSVGKTTKVALSFDELEALYKIDLSQNERLERTRDLLLIGAYTGLRFSDFTRIRPELIEERDGITILTIETQKTKQMVSIPLFEIPLTLLKKYKFSAPTLSNQKMNEYLKELGQLAGMTGKMVISESKGGKRGDYTAEKWEKLTTHIARRSFATNFYQDGKVPIGRLMLITGHSTERQFMQYIAIDGKENAVQLANLLDKEKETTSNG